MTQPEDKSILHEIVRVVESRRKVPEKIQVHTREYVITYLADHRNRLEEALRRYDSDRLNMLFGQLASKIKYQFNRMVPARAVEPPKPAKKEVAKKATKKATTKKAAAKKTTAKKTTTKTTTKAKVAAKKTPARKAAAKKTATKAAAKKKVAAKKHK